MHGTEHRSAAKRPATCLTTATDGRAQRVLLPVGPRHGRDATQARREGASLSQTARLTGIKVKELDYHPVASVRTCTDPGRLRRTIALMHDLVMEAVGEQGLAPAGPLFARYHRWGGVIDLEAGVPLAQSIQPVGVVLASTLPEGPALRLLHVGEYTTLPASYEALEAYIARHGYRADGGPWECYLVDGSDTPDAAEWRTEIYVPLRTRMHGRP